MPKRLTAIIAVLLISFGCLNAQSITVQVEEVEVGRGEASYLRVLCTTDIALAGLTIPLRIGENAEIVIDSVSFAHTVAVGGFRLSSQITDATRLGFVNVIPKLQTPLPTFPSPGGEICRIHFHTFSWSSPSYVPIDSFYRKKTVGQQVYYEQLDATDRWGTTLLPEFVFGGISIGGATSVDGEDGTIVRGFTLGQNYPNPFNPSTQIIFALERSDDITLEVFDIGGRSLVTLAKGRFPAGRHLVRWDAGRYSSGVYLYRLMGNSAVITRKMLLVK